MSVGFKERFRGTTLALFSGRNLGLHEFEQNECDLLLRKYFCMTSDNRESLQVLRDVLMKFVVNTRRK